METLIVDTGHGRQVVRETAFPNNSHKWRDVEEEDIVPIPMEIVDYSGCYRVKIPYNVVWPDVYGEEHIPFPTLKASWKFRSGRHCADSYGDRRLFWLLSCKNPIQRRLA